MRHGRNKRLEAARKIVNDGKEKSQDERIRPGCSEDIQEVREKESTVDYANVVAYQGPSPGDRVRGVAGRGRFKPHSV